MAVRNTRPVSALADPDVMRSVLDAAGTLLDGKPAAAWTAQGNRAIVANALEYAVERKLLGTNQDSSKSALRCVNVRRVQAALLAEFRGSGCRCGGYFP